jgi:hypothetical protein
VGAGDLEPALPEIIQQVLDVVLEVIVIVIGNGGVGEAKSSLSNTIHLWSSPLTASRICCSTETPASFVMTMRVLAPSGSYPPSVFSPYPTGLPRDEERHSTISWSL